MAGKKPQTVEDVRQAMYMRAWRALARQHWAVKTLLAVVVLILGAAAARIGFMGEPAQKIARVAVPQPIPGIETPKAKPALTLTFDVVSNGVQKAGQNAAIYRSGDTIILHVAPAGDAWTIVFGIDAKGRHAVIGRNFEPVLLLGDKTHDVRFRLDDTTGVETYYAIAAAEPFTFGDDIAPKLDPGKGPQMIDLPLDDRFAQQAVSFIHVAR
jgi:hypothetical protein